MPTKVDVGGDFVVHGDVFIGDSGNPIGRPRSAAILLKLGDGLFRGAAGERLSGIRPVRVVDAAGRPLADVAVRYRVLAGPVALHGGEPTHVVSTDDAGYAPVSVELRARGSGVLTAELVDDPTSPVPFATRTEGVTDQIYLRVAPCLNFSDSPVAVHLRCVDHQGAPVDGARLHLATAIGRRYREPGEVSPSAHGRYTGVAKLSSAGAWTIEVSDLDTGAIGLARLQVLPGPADKIRIVKKEDPRDAVPRSTARVLVDLIDGAGNSLDPTRLQVEAEEADVTLRAWEDLLEISLHRDVPGMVAVRITDRESNVRREIEVGFSAACFGDPGVLLAGQSYSTPLYLFPRRPGKDDAGGIVPRAEISLSFDPKLVACRGFEPSVEGLQITSKITDKSLEVIVVSEHGLDVVDDDDGLYVGEIEWECLGAGSTCFEAAVSMSPAGPPWRWCRDQKENNSPCICIEVLYPKNYRSGPGFAAQARQNVLDVLSSDANVGRCCPILQVRLHHREWTDAELRKVIAAIAKDGNGDVNSEAEAFALMDAGTGDHPNCIQLFLVTVNTEHFSGGASRGKIVLDPVAFPNRNNVPAHEVAHTLGLPDRYEFDNGQVKNTDPNDLMGIGPPPRHDHGNQLSAEDCQTIWGHLDRFRCP